MQNEPGRPTFYKSNIEQVKTGQVNPLNHYKVSLYEYIWKNKLCKDLF